MRRIEVLSEEPDEAQMIPDEEVGGPPGIQTLDRLIGVEERRPGSDDTSDKGTACLVWAPRTVWGPDPSLDSERESDMG
jgi:hypothetical protein